MKDEADSTVSLNKQLQTKQKQVYSIAYGPAKNILTTGFMLWMSGSSIQIFSLMMTGMALWTPINAIASLNKTFSRYDGEAGIDLNIPKLIFISLQIFGLAIAIYKCSTMGLLPLTSADWTHYIPHYQYLEHAGVPS
jgi:ER membrane protein complex subunit 4